MLSMPSKDPLVLFYTTFFSKPVDIASIHCDFPGQWTLDKRRIAEAAAVVFHIPNFREIGDAWKYPRQFSLVDGEPFKLQADLRSEDHAALRLHDDA
ncbi:hypothetical protein OHD62_13720 [Mesorhizobium sp. YC-39]|uniref:hypothetical protein n=1 Tax=unclassified Mesorhizobium TaxID=325217 RepID=UPI0021E88DBF|nr:MULTISPECIES: hypothetical protein [unclassified Mesorhizobium]MCV3207697.1 hypothetical protein [Mesorhizobium sp. YC-2]MCV3229424.1 hypothetical protein [Mesorhizobium sp. YC-39]